MIFKNYYQIHKCFLSLSLPLPHSPTSSTEGVSSQKLVIAVATMMMTVYYEKLTLLESLPLLVML